MHEFDKTNPSLVEATLEDHTLPGISEGEIIVIRSARRKKNISAYRQGGRIVVSIPARMSKADERAMIPEMVAKIRAQEAAATMSEESLSIRVGELLSELAPEITVRPSSVNWRGMRERWGSCTGVDRSIRVSDRLKGAPEYVLDYVLFHEAIQALIPFCTYWESVYTVSGRPAKPASANTVCKAAMTADSSILLFVVTGSAPQRSRVPPSATMT